jgi:hypothetical protein
MKGRKGRRELTVVPSEGCGALLRRVWSLLKAAAFGALSGGRDGTAVEVEVGRGGDVDRGPVAAIPPPPPHPATPEANVPSSTLPPPAEATSCPEGLSAAKTAACVVLLSLLARGSAGDCGLCAVLMLTSIKRAGRGWREGIRGLMVAAVGARGCASFEKNDKITLSPRSNGPRAKFAPKITLYDIKNSKNSSETNVIYFRFHFHCGDDRRRRSPIARVDR